MRALQPHHDILRQVPDVRELCDLHAATRNAESDRFRGVGRHWERQNLCVADGEPEIRAYLNKTRSASPIGRSLKTRSASLIGRSLKTRSASLIGRSLKIGFIQLVILCSKSAQCSACRKHLDRKLFHDRL